ncbi:MAG: ATP-binding protein, partial [Gemmatimonadota bacterium]|nr:ATP-binding protein [Gemmatimonadota bacterium]
MTILRPSLLGDCVIHVGDASVDPSSTHLFALLLTLTLHSERRTHRSELQRILFAPDIEPQQASHNLRQLLYRARRLGIVVDETAVGLRLASGSVVAYEEQLNALTSGECEQLDGASITFLPSYYPQLPNAFHEWLDCQRAQADNIIRTSLRVASTRLRDTHSWNAVHRVSSILLTLDPHSEETVAVVAESLAMLSRRDEALLLIASFGARSGQPGSPADSLRALRARIVRLGNVKPEVILRGRDECFAYLDAEWAKIGGDGARRAALVGAAGVGKTRIGEAFATRISLRGGRVTRYTCTPASSHQPLGLFSDILPELRRLRGSIGASPDYASALDRLRPMAAPAGMDGLFDISVEAVRTQVQRALIDLLEAVSDERPLLLLVDDAQYLDPVSIDVVRALCAKPNTAQLLVLVCIRRSHLGSSLLEQAKRGNAYVLEPLSPDDSRQIVLDVAGIHCAQEHITWCVSQAAGNPYYLHTLASQRFSDSGQVPFDIRSLASSAYSSLSASARSVLDTCLLLGRLASINRVTRVAAVADPELLLALRELEAVELLQFKGGLLSGPHALLQDALRALIPSSVAALLHTRIATQLEHECAVEHYMFPIAWAAAQSWLAAGEPHHAAHLVRQCARQAALVGEPTAATSLLSVIVDASLPPALHAELLDELMAYAE